MATTNLRTIAAGEKAGQAAEARNPFDALKRQLEGGKSEFLPLMGNSQTNVDRFIRVVLNAALATPDLLQADRRSLIAACMKAAQDGLTPDGREAVLNIYNTKKKWQENGKWHEQWVKQVQYLPMVGGLVKKLYESGEVINIDAACVFANDRFVYRRGDDPKLEHEPTMDDEPGPVVAAYVVAKLKSGEIKREVMPRRDIEAVRAASKSGNNGPWVTWYDQQAIKSVIKRAYKQLPKADAFEKVEASDNQSLGFAATPQSVGDIVARQAAIEHQPADPIQFDVQATEHEHVGGDEPDHGQETEAVLRQAPAISYADVIAGMLKAKTREALDEAAALIQAVADEGQRKELGHKYDALRAELAA